MSNNEELILEIVEKLDAKLDKLNDVVHEMKIEQTYQNGVVEHHQVRSTQLEGRQQILEKAVDDRLKNLEKDAQFFRNFIMIMTGLGAVITFVVKVIPYFVH